MFLVGYQGEKISVPLEEGFEQAKKIASRKIEDTIEDDVGGDEVRILSYDTIYEDITFKQIMGPVYNGIYYYNGTKYSFVMNGQTGTFAGSYPMSGVKIFFFVSTIVILSFFGLLDSSQTPQLYGSKREPSDYQTRRLSRRF